MGTIFKSNIAFNFRINKTESKIRKVTYNLFLMKSKPTLIVNISIFSNEKNILFSLIRQERIFFHELIDRSSLEIKWLTS